MLRSRTMAAAVRAIAPEVLAGAYTDLELSDLNPGNFSTTVNEEGDITVIETKNETNEEVEEAQVLEITETEEVKQPTKKIIKKK